MTFKNQNNSLTYTYLHSLHIVIIKYLHTGVFNGLKKFMSDGNILVTHPALGSFYIEPDLNTIYHQLELLKG